MITSRQNEKIKSIRALKDKKQRDVTGLFTVEGVKLVKEALASLFPVITVVGTEEGLSKIPFECDVEKLLVSDDVFKAISNETSPEGVMAVVKKKEFPLISPKGNCVFLDGVADPANVGAIMRTAAAVGVTDIYCYNSADAYSPKSVRASMGGVFRLKVHTGDKEQLFSAIDKPVVVADMKGENVFSGNFSGQFCLVIGNEANGVEQDILDKANYTVSIPMENGMESLNAAVSAGILMYALKEKAKK